MKILKTKKVILFDHDDTLVGTIQAKWAQHKYIARTYYKKELSDEEILIHWGKPFSVLVKELYETEDVEKALGYNANSRHHFQKDLFPGTLETLQALKRLGLKIGIVTATTRSSLDYDFSTLDIPKDHFHYIQTEENSTFHKPDPKVFDPAKAWLEKLGVSPEETLYVGDGFNDMNSARGAGFDFIGVCTGLVTPEAFQGEGVETIGSLSELLYDS